MGGSALLPVESHRIREERRPKERAARVRLASGNKKHTWTEVNEALSFQAALTLLIMIHVFQIL